MPDQATPAIATPAAAAQAAGGTGASANPQAQGQPQASQTAGQTGQGQPGTGQPGGQQPAGQPPAGASWPDNWREDFSRGDEKLLARMQRYASPKDALNALISAQNKISSGELKSILPKDPSPEQLTQWRIDQGIPDAPEKYDLKELKIEEDDKPFVDAFLKQAHGANFHPSQVKAALSWYFAEQQRAVEAQETADKEFHRQSEDALRAEWGQDYRTNVNLIGGILDMAPQGVKDLIKGARLADGKVFASHPDVLRWLTQLARTINPVHAIVPGSGGNVGQAIGDEIAQIEKTMRENRKEYNRNEKMQARYRELLDAQNRMKQAA